MPTIIPNHSLFNLLHSDCASLWLAEATFWKFCGLHLWPTGCAPFCTTESMVHRHQMQATRTSIPWHAMYWIFVGAGLYKDGYGYWSTASAGEHKDCSVSYLIVVDHYVIWQQEGSLCIEEVDGASSLTCIERQSGPIVVWCEYSRVCCQSKSECSSCMPPWYHEGACRVALYRGAIGGVANPFGYCTWPKIFLPLHYVCIWYSFDIYATNDQVMAKVEFVIIGNWVCFVWDGWMMDRSGVYIIWIALRNALIMPCCIRYLFIYL